MDGEHAVVITDSIWILSKSDESELVILRGRYEAYASRHVRNGTEEAAAQVDRRYIRPLRPRPAVSPLLDPRGGEPVRASEADSFDAEGTDIIPEQAALALAATASDLLEDDVAAAAGRLRLGLRALFPARRAWTG
jgi:hypothetical protein